jgi:hypothetical protein
MIQSVNTLKNATNPHTPIIHDPERPFPWFIHDPERPSPQTIFFCREDKALNNLHTTEVDKPKGLPLIKERQCSGDNDYYASKT